MTKGKADTDMTVQDFYSGFNLDFMTEEERQTIYTCTELYARGKVRQPSFSLQQALDMAEKAFKEPYKLGRVHPGNNMNKDWEQYFREHFKIDLP